MALNVNTKNHDEYLTPPEIIESCGEFELDPCSPVKRPWDTAKTHFTKEDNGLSMPWFGRVWLNPPYGRETGKWIEKMAYHDYGTALIFVRTDIKMWHDFVWPAARGILFLKGRIHFYNVEGKKYKQSAGAPSCLIAYGNDDLEALTLCRLPGKLVIL